jgi:hypothetical protein
MTIESEDDNVFWFVHLRGARPLRDRKEITRGQQRMRAGRSGLNKSGSRPITYARPAHQAGRARAARNGGRFAHHCPIPYEIALELDWATTDVDCRPALACLCQVGVPISSHPAPLCR